MIHEAFDIITEKVITTKIPETYKCKICDEIIGLVSETSETQLCNHYDKHECNFKQGMFFKFENRQEAQAYLDVSFPGYPRDVSWSGNDCLYYLKCFPNLVSLHKIDGWLHTIFTNQQKIIAKQQEQIKSLKEPEEFKECDDCASKPGSPTLCDDCYKRRNEFYSKDK